MDSLGNYRSPTKVRARREHLSDVFPDDIPVRDIMYKEETNAQQYYYTDEPSHIPTQQLDMDSDRNRSSNSLEVENCGCRMVAGKYNQEFASKNNERHPRRRSAPELATQKALETQIFTSGVSEHHANFQTPLASSIYNLWQDKRFCDIKIRAGKDIILAHKLILAAYSDYFSKEESSNTEYEFPSSLSQAISDVINFCYTCQIDISSKTVDSLLVVAKQLGIACVVQMCREFLRRKNMDNNLVYHRIVAEKHEFPDIVRELNVFICRNFEKFVRSPGFLRCSFEEVFKLISPDNFGVYDDLAVFGAIAYWINHCKNERMGYAPRLLGLVKFAKISPADLQTRVESATEIFSLQECRNQLFNAYRYHALTLSGCKVQTSLHVNTTPAPPV